MTLLNNSDTASSQTAPSPSHGGGFFVPPTDTPSVSSPVSSNPEKEGSLTKPSSRLADGVMKTIGAKSGAVGMDTPRFQDIRYKIYVFCMILVTYIAGWGYEGIGGWGVEGYDRVMNVISQEETINAQVEDRQQTRKRYLDDIGFIKKIGEVVAITPGSVPALVYCFNRGEQCDSLDPAITEKLPLIRAFVQLQTLDTPKMEINEGKILKNINEFLLQADPLSPQLNYNGQLRDLSIGEPSIVKGLLYKLPLSMDVSFRTKDDVFAFLANIEDRIYFANEGGFEQNMLYVLESFNYDILQYSASQDVKATMSVYYYNSKKGFF